jgi:acyl dehydratase
MRHRLLLRPDNPLTVAQKRSFPVDCNVRFLRATSPSLRIVQNWNAKLSERKRSYHRQDAAATNTNPSLESTIPRMGRGVKVGQYATLERTYSHKEVEEFAALVHDYNPLHTALDWEQVMQDDDGDDESWKVHFDNGLIQFQEEEEGTDHRRTTKPIVHGMLVSSIFSSIFATLSPGCIYVNQSLNFCRPVFVGDTVMGSITIDRIRKWRKGGVVVECTTKVTKEQMSAASSFSSSVPLETFAPNSDEVGVFVKGVANVWLPGGYAV